MAALAMFVLVRIGRSLSAPSTGFRPEQPTGPASAGSAILPHRIGQGRDDGASGRLATLLGTRMPDVGTEERRDASNRAPPCVGPSVGTRP